MKKIRILLIAAVLLSLAFSALPAQAAVISKAERALFKEGVEAFLEMVQPKGIGQKYVLKGYSELSVWSPESPALAVASDEYGAQVEYSVKMQETNGVGFTIEAIKSFAYLPSGEVIAGMSADLHG